MSAGSTAKAESLREPGARKALPVLHVTNIAKSFRRRARRLRGVSFDVMPGEVHGLLGKNGSGKSTLVKILAGFHAPDPGGRLEFNGEHVHLPLKPGDFRRLGMSFVHQNLGLVPSLTVLENLRFAHLTAERRSFINWRAERAAAREALARFGLDLDPDERDRSAFAGRARAARHRPGLRGDRAPNAPPPAGPVLFCSTNRRRSCRAKASTSFSG